MTQGTHGPWYHLCQPSCSSMTPSAQQGKPAFTWLLGAGLPSTGRPLLNKKEDLGSQWWQKIQGAGVEMFCIPPSPSFLEECSGASPLLTAARSLLLSCWVPEVAVVHSPAAGSTRTADQAPPAGLVLCPEAQGPPGFSVCNTQSREFAFYWHCTHQPQRHL